MAEPRRTLAALGRTCAGFPAPTGQLTSVCGSDALVWPPQAHHARGAHMQAKKIIRIKKQPHSHKYFQETSNMHITFSLIIIIILRSH